VVHWSDVKRRVALVDPLVEAYVLALLDREGIGAPSTTTSAPDVRGKADAVRVKLEALEDKYADGGLPRAAYLRNRDRLAARLAELGRAEALTRVPGPLEGVTPSRWAALPLERRRAVVAYLVDVRLLPTHGGGRHDAELVGIAAKRQA
jgi:hypothetical protein